MLTAMPEYSDLSGNAMQESVALQLPVVVCFSITCDDGRSVECARDSSEATWVVGHRNSGSLQVYGSVRRKDEMYRPVDIAHMKSQETFSAAARKYL